MREKKQYTERRSGELLPRRASQYVPPHPIPSQPDARTMENQTVRISPELDPRLALTEVSQRRVHKRRRGGLGLVAAALFGTGMGLGVWGFEGVPGLSSSVSPGDAPTASVSAPLAPLGPGAGAQRGGRESPLATAAHSGSGAPAAAPSSDGSETTAAEATSAAPAQSHAPAGHGQAAPRPKARTTSSAAQRGAARSSPEPDRRDPEDEPWLESEGKKVWLK